jgi:hypothetical protein
MSWLKFNIEEAKIVIDPEAMVFKEVKKLWDSDISENKSYFNKVITWIYHVYKSEHAFESYLPGERKEKVQSVYFKGENVSEIENDPNVQAVIKIYSKDCMTTIERFYQNVQKDIEDLYEHIQSIKMFHLVKQQVEITVEYTNDSGEIVETKAKAKLPIKVDNSKEKLNAISQAQALMQLEQKLRIDLKKERNKNQNQRRLFDTHVEAEK